MQVISQALLDAGLVSERDLETPATTKKLCRQFVLLHHPDKKATETDEESQLFKLHLGLFQRLALLQGRAAAAGVQDAPAGRAEPLLALRDGAPSQLDWAHAGGTSTPQRQRQARRWDRCGEETSAHKNR